MSLSIWQIVPFHSATAKLSKNAHECTGSPNMLFLWWAWGYSLVIEQMLIMHEALGSIHSAQSPHPKLSVTCNSHNTVCCHLFHEVFSLRESKLPKGTCHSKNTGPHTSAVSRLVSTCQTVGLALLRK